jgi:hypothetical protein
MIIEEKTIGSYYDKSIITEDMTDETVTKTLKGFYEANKATIEEMFNKLQNKKQYLKVAFYPNGHINISIRINGSGRNHAEAISSVAIPFGGALDTHIDYGINGRFYRTLKELNDAIQATKEYENKQRAN